MNTFGEKEEGRIYREREGVYGLIGDGHGNIAIAGRTDKHHLELPGGGLEGDETHEEGLIREFIEEFGWEVKMGDYLGTCSEYVISESGRYWRMIGHFYKATKIREVEGKVEDNFMCVWIPTEEAAQKVFHYYQRWAISHYEFAK